MCGITAVLGIPASSFIIKSLRQLLNRGYDSSGVAVMIGKKVEVIKFCSLESQDCIVRLEQHLSTRKLMGEAKIGIAHTRWATHGAKTDANAHPHQDQTGTWSIVHNGIIENFESLKRELLGEGYVFQSETDTEVVVNLLSYQYKIQSPANSDPVKAILSTVALLQGTWGLVMMCRDTPDVLYTTRRGSPILINVSESRAIICSEASGFCNLVSDYIALKDNDLAIIEKKANTISITTQENYMPLDIKLDHSPQSPAPYPYWTQKEIYEQPESALRAISMGGRLLSDNQVRLGGLTERHQDLKSVTNLILLGCGTSYNAGKMGVQYFKELADLNIYLYDGGEFTPYDIPRKGKSALVLLSQSGETRDLYRCVTIGRESDTVILGVVNTVDSLIAREVDAGCYLNAGREVGVASTKVFVNQVLLLSMIAVWFAQTFGKSNEKRIKYISDLRNISRDLRVTIGKSETFAQQVADYLQHQHSVFILGKGKSQAISEEGALKMKEIAYIHAEGYSASSLKHGPFGLLEEGFPVILVSVSPEHYDKMNNVYQEVKARGVKIFTITNYQIDRPDTLIISTNGIFDDLLAIIPLQLIAFHLSIKKGINPDYPRNLAKVVTVE